MFRVYHLYVTMSCLLVVAEAHKGIGRAKAPYIRSLRALGLQGRPFLGSRVWGFGVEG